MTDHDGPFRGPMQFGKPLTVPELAARDSLPAIEALHDAMIERMQALAARHGIELPPLAVQRPDGMLDVRMDYPGSMFEDGVDRYCVIPCRITTEADMAAPSLQHPTDANGSEAP